MAAIFVAVHTIAERKVTLELSLSVMFTGKWSIESFVYSALRMDDGSEKFIRKMHGCLCMLFTFPLSAFSVL